LALRVSAQSMGGAPLRGGWRLSALTPARAANSVRRQRSRYQRRDVSGRALNGAGMLGKARRGGGAGRAGISLGMDL
jgi:hypothetical protein